MRVLIGIDEAGYGPTLGPLVVSSAAFQVPDESADLWRALAQAATRTKRGAGERLVVADSKAVYTRGSGLQHLERATLAFLAAGGGRPPRTFRELLARLCGGAETLCDSAWWSDAALPCAAEPEAVESAARLLADAQGAARFLGLAAQVVRAGSFNELIAKYKNKSVLLFQQNIRLVERAMARYEGDLSFMIDKHGGRHYYQQLLANNFFGHAVHVLHESPKTSSYEVEIRGRTLRFTFAEKADASHLPVALASMTAKYVRELFMMCFNAYWCGRVEGLTSTAGYAADSKRFIAAIEPFLDDTQQQNVIRQR